MMKTQEYWIKRMENLIKDEDVVIAKTAKAYKKFARDLDLALADLYEEMLRDGGISTANLFMNNRYVALQSTLVKLARVLGGEEENNLALFLNEKYGEEFMLSVEMIYGNKEYFLPDDTVEAALKTNWSGEMFSQRIWKDKSKLVGVLEELILDGVALGISRKELSKDLSKRLQIGVNNAERLIRTESNFIYNKAHFDVYQKAGLSKYEFLAEIDSRTSKVCRENNRKEFFLTEAQVGVNYPPLHPNCRSTVMPVLKK